MINGEHFYPAPKDFESFFETMAGISWVAAIELSKMDNESGEFNLQRMRFWTKVWTRYLEITCRQAQN